MMCKHDWVGDDNCAYCRVEELEAELNAAQDAIRSGWLETINPAIRPTHMAADAFWKYWRENGETHKHGYYESTWGAINAALIASQSDAEKEQP